MQEAQYAATAQHQCRAPVAHVTAVEKVEFLLGGDNVVRKLGQQPEGVVNFLNILLYELLGARLGLPVKHAFTHASHIAVDTLIERIQQAGPVFLLTEFAQSVKTITDLRVIVEI